MAYMYYNPNPSNKRVGDCVIRAISKLTGNDWETTYMNVAIQGYEMNDMPSANNVWGEYLFQNGYRRHVIPDTCPRCYTVADFCDEHKRGKYLLATGNHVVAVVNGNYYDSWDSGDEVPIYYWKKE